MEDDFPKAPPSHVFDPGRIAYGSSSRRGHDRSPNLSFTRAVLVESQVATIDNGCID